MKIYIQIQLKGENNMYKKLKKIFDSFFDNFKRNLISILVTFKDKKQFKKERKCNNYIRDTSNFRY